jgi:hypothetical protein
MRLTDIVSMALSGASAQLHGVAARLRRGAIAYGICAVCALAAIIMATSASILALEPLVGVVYARLIVAGVFVLIALITLLALRLARPRPVAAAAAATPLGARAEPSQRSAQFAQIAMIVEAVMLGYSLSRRSNRR